ncbi:hypothetical protein [Amycolatopsis dongchuanensis]|uniref:Uncharacterized protein n=1 Tax=Amycolatopsis dongchuanensis TaxID=1070866 RepID=A0ABP9QXZ7_9PSEU
MATEAPTEGCSSQTDAPTRQDIKRARIRTRRLLQQLAAVREIIKGIAKEADTFKVDTPELFYLKEEEHFELQNRLTTAGREVTKTQTIIKAYLFDLRELKWKHQD